jgi:hypothetical protein
LGKKNRVSTRVAVNRNNGLNRVPALLRKPQPSGRGGHGNIDRKHKNTTLARIYDGKSLKQRRKNAKLGGWVHNTWKPGKTFHVCLRMVPKHHDMSEKPTCPQPVPLPFDPVKALNSHERFRRAESLGLSRGEDDDGNIRHHIGKPCGELVPATAGTITDSLSAISYTGARAPW